MIRHVIREVRADLIASPVQTGFQDATRKVETVGMCVIRVNTDQGLTGIGVTYHEVHCRLLSHRSARRESRL